VGRRFREQSENTVDNRGREVAVLELDDIPSGNDLTRARCDDRGAEHQRQGREGEEVETHIEELSTKKPVI